MQNFNESQKAIKACSSIHYYLDTCHFLKGSRPVGQHFPQSHAVAPYVTGSWEMTVAYTLRGIPGKFNREVAVKEDWFYIIFFLRCDENRGAGKTEINGMIKGKRRWETSKKYFRWANKTAECRPATLV